MLSVSSTMVLGLVMLGIENPLLKFKVGGLFVILDPFDGTPKKVGRKVAVNEQSFLY